LENDSHPFSFDLINTRSVVDQIIENVKQALIRGDLHPGQRLPSEPELAQQLGVGRSAVREAMKVMEALGVVNIVRGSGTYITDSPSQQMISPLVFALILETGMTVEFFELRVSTQIGYCDLAARNATDEDWKQIEAAAQALEDYARQPKIDSELLTQLDLDFHYTILEATHNPLVIKIGRAVEEMFFTSIHNTLVAFNQPDWAIESHRGIIRAIRSKDLTEIRAAIDYSLLHWREEVQDETRRMFLKGKEQKQS